MQLYTEMEKTSMLKSFNNTYPFQNTRVLNTVLYQKQTSVCSYSLWNIAQKIDAQRNIKPIFYSI